MAAREDLLAAADADGHDRHAATQREVRGPVEQVTEHRPAAAGALREDGEGLPVDEDGVGGAQRGPVGAAPLDGDAAERREHRPPEPGSEQLLLGEEAEPAPGRARGERDVDDRSVRRRHDVGPVGRDVVAADDPDAEQHAAQRDHDAADHPPERPPHRGAPVRSWNASTISRTTSSTGRPVVSMRSASGAGWSGDVARVAVEVVAPTRARPAPRRPRRRGEPRRVAGGPARPRSPSGRPSPRRRGTRRCRCRDPRPRRRGARRPTPAGARRARCGRWGAPTRWTRRR